MNKTKRILAAFIAATTILTMAGCGTSGETGDGTGIFQSSSQKLKDDSVLEIDMGNGEKISYHGQPFSEFMSELETRFGVEFDLVESKKTDVQYKTYKTIDYFKTSNGNFIKFNYSVDNKELSINIEGLNLSLIHI